MTEAEKQAWDLYAAQAAAGILAGRVSGSSLHENPALPGTQQFIARDAAAIADQLLAQRQQRRL
ncbi:MAG: hypothetical protein OXH14_08450 [Alphaproteobacteria bacterium]|nr:hypothetical protein [Alphaproteobacteria bacterium]